MTNDNNGRLSFEATIDDKDFKKKIDSMNKGVEGLAKESDKSSKVIEQNTRKQSTLFSKLNTAISGVGKTIGAVFSNFGLFAGLGAFISLLSGAARDVVAFDKSMTNLSAIAGVSRSSLKDLESDIRKVASSSINTATAVADMAMELIKLGTTPQGVRDLLKPVNDLSIAFQSSADATAVLLKGTLNAFQESESEAQRYADVMAMSANKTALGFQEIADSFSYISATASVAGYSIEETAAFMGVLVDNNVQASSAGRVLSSVFGRLAKGGKELEGELEKIRNSQDKLAQASKIFGSEGARLGVILANNKDRLYELNEEFKNSSGSLAKLTNQQLESISAQYEITKSAWQELILSIENGKGVISTFVKEWLEGLTMIFNAISKISKTYGELKNERMSAFSSGVTNLIDKQAIEIIRQREKAYKEQGKEYTAEKKHLDEVALKNKMIADQRETASSRLLEIEKELKAIEAKPDSRNYDRTINLQKEQENLQAKINGLKEYEKKVNEIIVKEDETKVDVLEDINNKTKERLALLDKIDKAERSINESVLSERESAIQKTLEKYRELNKEAVKLGMNTQRIKELESRELEVVTYKADTNKLKESLLEQRKLYEEFENFKKSTSEKYAKEIYSNIIDVNKNYYDVLSDELDKIDVNTMEDKERNRYGILTTMLLDYTEAKDKIEKEQLEKLFNETKTTEERITSLKLEYEKKRSKILQEYSGKDQESRLNELGKSYNKDISNLFNEFLDEEGFAVKITNAVTSATKESILAQIQSLRGFLNTAKGLTKEQVDSVKKNIIDLENKLSTATSSTGEGNRLSFLNNHIKQLLDAKQAMEEAIEKAPSKFGEAANSEIAKLRANIEGIDAQLKNLGGQKNEALAEVFGQVSNVFSNMANDMKGVNEGASKMFATMAKVSNMAGQINSSLGAMKNHMNAVNNGTADFSTAFGAGAGYLGIFMSVVGAIDGIIQKSRANQERRDEERRLRQEQYYLGELSWQRQLSEMELERLRRQSLGLKGRRDELEAMYNDALLKESQINDIASKIFDPNRVLLAIHSNQGYEEYTNASVEEIIKTLESNIEKFKDSADEWDKKNVARWRKNLEYWRNDVLLTGKSWQELDRMVKQGLISKENLGLVNQFINLNKQLEEAGLNIEDLKQAMYEMSTGTTLDALSDTFANFLKNGEDAVYGFGQSFEDILKNAVVSAFKNEFIVSQMKPLFDMMGQMGIKGDFTQEEIDKLREEAKKISELLQIQWDQISGALDLDFGTSAESSMRDSVKRITEQQADRLVGITMGIQTMLMQNQGVNKSALETLITSQNLLNSSYQTLISIEANTRRSADGIDSINGKLDTIISNNSNSYTKSLGL